MLMVFIKHSPVRDLRKKKFTVRSLDVRFIYEDPIGYKQKYLTQTFE